MQRLWKKSVVPDATFTNTTDGADTHPFDSGDKCDYTVQVADALVTDTYYWRVSGLDPTGSNTYGAWAATRSFTVDTGDEMLSGVLGRDTAKTITLHMAANQSRTVDREDILSMEPSALSIMPEGLVAGLKDEELVDLITFLLSLNNEKWLQPVQRGAKKKPKR